MTIIDRLPYTAFDAVAADVAGDAEFIVDLRSALAAEQLFVAYQPIVELSSGKLRKVEALARWNHPERGEIPPDAFIPLAERTGMIDELGDWILERACLDVVAMREYGLDIDVNVNFSVAQLCDPSIVERTEAILARSGLAADRLWIEVTENAFLDDASLATLLQLGDLGPHVVIDDFGTGFSTYQYIQRLSIDALKVDRTFVAGLGVSPTDTAIVRSVAKLGQELGIEIVVEGVETESQRLQLMALNVGLGQGWLFAPAMRTADLVEQFGPSAAVAHQTIPSGEMHTDHRVALAALDQSRDLIAVLDGDGTIVMTNAAWRAGSEQRGGLHGKTGPGVNYLDVCCRSDAAVVTDGVRAVLRGDRTHFTFEYPCDSPLADGWWALEVSSIGGPGAGAVVTHTDISARVASHRGGGPSRDVDPVTMLATSCGGVGGPADLLADAQARGGSLAVVTITLVDLDEIESRHGRRVRDDLVVGTLARVRRITSRDDAMIRPSTNQLVLFDSVADAHGGEFLRDKIANVLAAPYLVGTLTLDSRADVTVVSSDAFSTIDSLLGTSTADRTYASMSTSAPDSRSAGVRGLVGDGAASVPLMVYSLPDGYLQAANDSARSLCDLELLESGRARFRESTDAVDQRRMAAALSMLNTGAIDSFRTRRTLSTSTGPIDVVTSVRRILVGSGALAVAETVPADSCGRGPTVAEHSTVALIAGTIDHVGAITSVSSADSTIESELGALLNGSLRQAAHPDDARMIDEMVATARLEGAASGAVRVLHRELGWMTCQCQLFTIKQPMDREPSPKAPLVDHDSFTFVMSTNVATTSMATRLARLEGHLERIGAEVVAAGVGLTATSTDDRGAAALSALELTTRQRDIVERLVQGQRVSSIASALYISRSTVRNHLTQVYRLVGVHSQEELLDALQAS